MPTPPAAASTSTRSPARSAGRPTSIVAVRPSASNATASSSATPSGTSTNPAASAATRVGVPTGPAGRPDHAPADQRRVDALPDRGDHPAHAVAGDLGNGARTGPKPRARNWVSTNVMFANATSTSACPGPGTGSGASPGTSTSGRPILQPHRTHPSRMDSPKLAGGQPGWPKTRDKARARWWRRAPAAVRLRPWTTIRWSSCGQYTLHPGARDTLVALFEAEFVTGQEAAGIHVIGTFRDLDDPDRFVWLRGFSTMDDRKAALERFYYGPVCGRRIARPRTPR